ncbi:MAG TPA: hypothetical protein VD969_18130 [Symbiobacteriaceae bacterium]|nr:hypothetical protein [Symbiobacteriaceae bacterium]
MKRIVLIGMLVLALAAMTGCLTGTGAQPESGVTPSDGAVAFEVLSRSNWPTEVADWVARATQGQGGPVYAGETFGEKTYLLIFGGVLPSEGYTIKFEKVEAYGGRVTVTAEVKGPSNPWSSRVEMPVAVARIARHTGPIEFQVSRESGRLPK